MKILYLITKSNWGGAQRYVYDLAIHFSTQANYEVAVALGTPSRNASAADGGDGELKRKLEEKNVRVIRLAELGRDIKILGDIKAFFEILKLLREEAPYIVHLNSTKAGFFGSLACFFYKLRTTNYELRTIFTAHGWAFNEPRPWWQKLAIKKMQWLTVLSCDRTIVVSEHLKKQTWWWPFVSGKIHVIYNGVPELSFFPREEAIARLQTLCGKLPVRCSLKGLERLHLTGSFPQEVRIVTIAELHKNKGLDVAIEALAILKKESPALPFRYFIIGEGEERAKLEMLINRYELEDRVFLAGHIPNAYRYLKAFDLFLLPSRTEALGYALLEAGRAGLPVVATSVGGIPEVVEHKKTGLLVPKENPRALAYALRFMTAHPNARADAGSEFKNKIKKNFAIAKMFANTQNIYATPLVPFVKKRGYAYSTPSRK